MYLRFIAPWRLRRGVDAGLFWPAGHVRDDPATPEIVRVAIEHEMQWFDNELPAPNGRHFRVKSRGKWRSVGLCWFRDDAGEMIARAYGLAALLREAGVPISLRRCDDPGQILYRDRWQIVAKPRADTPTRWA